MSHAEQGEALLTVREVASDFGGGGSFGDVFCGGVEPLNQPALGPFACVKPEAFAVHFQDVDMMREAIEERPGETFRAEDRGPLIEWQVTGDERGAALIALAEHLEEQFRTDSGEWHITQFVDDQQFDRVEVFLQRP